MSLDISRVKKAFGGFLALDDVSLKLADGAMAGVIGPNGAGKSTLFAVISGFAQADSGSVTLDGRTLDGLAPAARARAGMVRSFQVPREFRHLTVRENLMAAAPDQTGEGLFGLFFRGRRVAAEEAMIREEAEAVIDRLNLRAVAELPAGRLSGGQKKLLELGRVLMVRPRTILLDEPFAGVNPVLIKEIERHIRALNESGIGFLIIEHDLAALSRLVPHLTVLDQGRVIAAGTPRAVLAESAVRDAYLGGGGP
jgi:branched-chain amino acid transport system ATP-binding protein